MQTNLIKSQDGNDLYLSCRNNDAINDYIINLILQKINQLEDAFISQDMILSFTLKNNLSNMLFLNK
jgi:hypothetical protein